MTQLNGALMEKTLFIIGGQRCGTSYFRDLLKQHPSISFAEKDKSEPKYFIQNPTANSDIHLYIFMENSAL